MATSIPSVLSSSDPGPSAAAVAVPEQQLATAAYLRVEPELAHLDPSELARVQFDIPRAITIALGALPRIRDHRAAMLALPDSPAAQVDKLEDYALACWYAHVRATPLGDGRWRYDYALMNLDFARAQTQGSEPNLRVLHNYGFDRILLEIPAGLAIESSEWSDGAGLLTPWAGERNGNRYGWAATEPAASLTWGSLLRLSLVANAAPVAASAELRIQEPGTPATLTLETLAPAELFGDGFETP